jgi:hypothetical protein
MHSRAASNPGGSVLTAPQLLPWGFFFSRMAPYAQSPRHVFLKPDSAREGARPSCRAERLQMLIIDCFGTLDRRLVWAV